MTVCSVLVLLHDHGKGIGPYRWGVDGELSAMWPLLRVWWLFALAVYGLMIYYSMHHGYFRIHRDKLFRTKWYGLYVIPVIFVLNCLSPFFGLKTVDTLSMWSNLNTLNGGNNHLIIKGNALKIFPYGDDMVEILDTNVPVWRRKYAQEGRLVAWTMLKQMVQNQVRGSRGRVFIKYIRNGQEHTVEDAAWDPDLMEPNPYWFRKCVFIKAIRKGPVQDCTW